MVFSKAYDIIQNTIANQYVLKNVNKFYQELDKDIASITKDVTVLEEDDNTIQIDRAKSIFLENLGLSISLTTILGLLLLGAIIYGLIRWFKKKRSNRLRHNRNQSNRGPSIEMENL